MTIPITGTAISLLAAAIFVLILFGITDWYELVMLAIIIVIAIYVITRYA